MPHGYSIHQLSRGILFSHTWMKDFQLLPGEPAGKAEKDEPRADLPYSYQNYLQHSPSNGKPYLRMETISTSKAEMKMLPEF